MNEDKKCECKKPWHRNRWIIKILGIFLIVWVWVNIVNGIEASHYIGETNGPATITVSGTGNIVATPDIATFDFTVTNTAASVADAQTQTTAKMNSITDFLKKNNIAAADIQTTDYSIYPQYSYQNIPCPMYAASSASVSGGVMIPTVATPVCPPSQNVLTGYNVSESITVKIRDLSTAGTILSGIGEFGVTNVSGLSFTENNYDDLVKQAEASAITDAKTNAATLAKNLGVKIVRLVSYSNQSQSPIMYALPMAASVDSKAATPEISAGQNKITANASLVYEIR